MQKNKKRKGFTLTELAIVIAVIAILIAVLVPTFTSLITSANESADEQAVKSMNTALATDEALNETPKTIEDAMKVLTDAGYNVENYQALDSNNTIYYDSTYNRCLLWSAEDGAVIYPSDLAETYKGVSGRAASWYTLSDAYNTKTVANSTELTTAISGATAGDTVIVQLTDSVDVSSAMSNSNGAYITIDLNENELNINVASSSIISNGSTLYLKNGSIDTSAAKFAADNGVFKAESGSSVTLENVDISGTGVMLYPAGDAAQVNVINSTIYTTGGFCISTNASTAYSCTILVENSTLQVEEGYCTICVNVDASLTINNSTIIAGSYGMDQSTSGVMSAGVRGVAAQAIICRAGTVNISDSTVTLYTQTSTNNTVFWYSTGNYAPYTAIVLGDATGGYTSANAEITMSNCTVNVCNYLTGDILENGRAIYMYGKDTQGYKSTLNFDSNTTINGQIIVGGSQDVSSGYSGYPAKYECEVVYINDKAYYPTTNSDSTTTGKKYTVSGTTLIPVS